MGCPWAASGAASACGSAALVLDSGGESGAPRVVGTSTVPGTEMAAARRAEMMGRLRSRATPRVGAALRSQVAGRTSQVAGRAGRADIR